MVWGDPAQGGSGATVAARLKGNITDVIASQQAFAATTSSGDVVSWGAAEYGEILAQCLVVGLSKPFARLTEHFAALMMNGNVVSWGDSSYGGESTSNTHGLAKWDECEVYY